MPCILEIHEKYLNIVLKGNINIPIDDKDKELKDSLIGFIEAFITHFDNFKNYFSNNSSYLEFLKKFCKSFNI